MLSEWCPRKHNVTSWNVCWLWIVRRREGKDGNVYFMHILIMHSFAHPGSSTQIRHLALRSLLPNTDQYMTYEGSTTHPGCWESAVWIILNKPIYITKQEVIYTWTWVNIFRFMNTKNFIICSCTRWEGSCKEARKRQRLH